jgi:hypothetical protein
MEQRLHVNVELSIIPSNIEGELRIRDIDLGERLGFSAPIDVRKLVRRYEAGFTKLGLPATVAKIPEGRGRPSTEFYRSAEAVFVSRCKT